MSDMHWVGDKIIQTAGEEQAELGYVEFENDTRLYVLWLKDYGGGFSSHPGGYVRGEDWDTLDDAKANAITTASAKLLHLAWLKTRQSKSDHKARILREFKLFSLRTDGIGGWLSEETDDKVFDRLDNIDEQPLNKVQLNQLLVFGHEAIVSDDFYHYYWLELPKCHPYKVSDIPGFQPEWVELGANHIQSLAHLKWGLYRLFVDGLLYFGNVQTAYRELRNLTKHELDLFFSERRFNIDVIMSRGTALDLLPIPQNDRYLISEMVMQVVW